MKNLRRVIWGLVLIAAAIVMVLNSFNVIDFDVFFDGWWTLFIIIPSFVGLFEKGNQAGSLVGLLLGVCLLLNAQNIVPFDVFWKILIPVIIAYIGIKMVVSSLRKGKTDNIYKKIKLEGKDIQNSVAVFCGTDLDFDGVVFNGANLTAIFGGIDCDLSNAIIEHDCIIKLSVAFGGVEIQVPDNVKVVTNVNAIFGGVDILKSNPHAAHTLYIDGTCTFGGVDIQ